METTDQAAEGRSASPNRSRRTAPQEIEGFQNVVLNPGGPVEVTNISNSGMLVETGTRVKPGRPVQVSINTTDGSHLVQAKIVRAEVTTVDENGLHFELAISFDDTQDLIDDALVVDAPDAGGAGPADRLPPDPTSVDLRAARTPNRW